MQFVMGGGDFQFSCYKLAISNKDRQCKDILRHYKEPAMKLSVLGNAVQRNTSSH